jgi:hypothetical protein
MTNLKLSVGLSPNIARKLGKARMTLFANISASLTNDYQLRAYFAFSLSVSKSPEPARDNRTPVRRVWPT